MTETRSFLLIRRMIAVTLSIVMAAGSAMLYFGEDAFAAKAKKPAKVKLASVKRSGLKITVKWKKAKNVRKYQVYQKIGSGKWKLRKTLKKLSLTVKGAYGKTYSFRIRGVNGKKKGKFSAVKTLKVPKKSTPSATPEPEPIDPGIDPAALINIIMEPADVTVKDGEEAVFSVEATGEGLRYQWYKNKTGNNLSGTPVAGATGPELKVTAALGDLGSYYYCRISNDSEMIKTKAALLDVEREDKAYIISQTEAVSAFEGDAPRMSIEAVGVGNLTYQWYKNDAPSNEGGEPIEEAVNESYQISRVYKENDGDYYYCVVTDTVKKAGKVLSETYAVSSPIRITVSEAPEHTRAVAEIKEIIKNYGVLTTHTVTIDDKEYYVLAEEDGKALLFSKGDSGYKSYIISGDYTWKYNGSGARNYLNGTFLKDNVMADVMSVPAKYCTPDHEQDFVELEDKVFILSEADVSGSYSHKMYQTERLYGDRIGDPVIRELDYEKDFTFDRTESHIGKALPKEIADMYVDGQLETWFVRSHYDVDWFYYNNEKRYDIHAARINTDSGDIVPERIYVPAREPHAYTYVRAAFWVEIGTDWRQ